MNFLRVIKFLKLGGTICFNRRKKSQEPDPRARNIFLCFIADLTYLIFWCNICFVKLISPPPSTSGLYRCRDNFSTRETELDYFRPKVGFFFFLRQVRKKIKRKKRKLCVVLLWLDYHCNEVLYQLNPVRKSYLVGLIKLSTLIWLLSRHPFWSCSGIPKAVKEILYAPYVYKK